MEEDIKLSPPLFYSNPPLKRTRTGVGSFFPGIHCISRYSLPNSLLPSLLLYPSAKKNWNESKLLFSHWILTVFHGIASLIAPSSLLLYPSAKKILNGSRLFSPAPGGRGFTVIYSNFLFI